MAKGDKSGGSIKTSSKKINHSSGSLNVDSKSGSGGLIDIEGKKVALLNAHLSAKGNERGGNIRIGGEFQGGKRQNHTTNKEYFGFVNRFGKLPKIFNAEQTYVDNNSTIDISSRSGSGGRL